MEHRRDPDSGATQSQGGRLRWAALAAALALPFGWRPRCAAASGPSVARGSCAAPVARDSSAISGLTSARRAFAPPRPERALGATARRSVFGIVKAALAALVLSAPALAERGPVTNLPLPRYVSLKGSEGNARRGPSTSHRIDWVFVRRDMPLQVIGEYDNWRQVRDREGATGWVHYTLISGVRTVIVDYDMVPLRSSPQDGGAVVAHLESGVIARLGDCNIDWCRVSVDGYRGWLRKTAIWGVDADETRD